MKSKEFITVNDLAKEFGVNKSCIAYWISVNKLSVRGILGKMYYLDRGYALKTTAKLVKEREAKS